MNTTVRETSSSSRNEYDLGGTIALLLQDHRTLSIKSVCNSQYMVTDQHRTMGEQVKHSTLSYSVKEWRYHLPSSFFSYSREMAPCSCLGAWHKQILNRITTESLVCWFDHQVTGEDMALGSVPMYNQPTSAWRKADDRTLWDVIKTATLRHGARCWRLIVVVQICVQSTFLKIFRAAQLAHNISVNLRLHVSCSLEWDQQQIYIDRFCLFALCMREQSVTWFTFVVGMLLCLTSIL